MHEKVIDSAPVLKILDWGKEFKFCMVLCHEGIGGGGLLMHYVKFIA